MVSTAVVRQCVCASVHLSTSGPIQARLKINIVKLLLKLRSNFSLKFFSKKNNQKLFLAGGDITELIPSRI